ncbi:5-hydroxytryptamine receptor 3A isoform X1 [Labrus bergylta]|uniref:5-hydroxytryptamine receptor 3A isoform X1 n=2 Tax=Labrus bergylta TaxID=56723 RepID=UPI0009B4AAC3|nr:5-hydroxytryptamine receptor 3A-like isoform X1 [Labrus bergylta]
MLSFCTSSVWKAVLLLILQTTGCWHAESTCKTRRCLAEMLMKRGYLSQPQSENCSLVIEVPFLEYQTLSVNTKELMLISQIRADLLWRDEELAWNRSDYLFDKVTLPVKNVWTPEILVTNGISSTMKHSSSDLLLFWNGTVVHSVIINAKINCEINLFNFPFAGDSCPVAIQTWSDGECGTKLNFHSNQVMIDGSHGDWQTDGISLLQQEHRDDRNYILVELSVKYLNPFITLMLPSILLVLADVVSFALPLGGGERCSFKVTLVLSFTMFLIILNDELPGDSTCGPIIRTHFCICLVLLVLSMLVSMMLTGLANNGSLIFSCWSKKGSRQENTGNKAETEDEEVKADISVIKLNASEGDSGMLKTLVDFVEDLKAQKAESEQYQKIAQKADKIFFWFYLFFGTAYFIAMFCVMTLYKCTVNHFEFWY